MVSVNNSSNPTPLESLSTPGKSKFLGFSDYIINTKTEEQAQSRRASRRINPSFFSEGLLKKQVEEVKEEEP